MSQKERLVTGNHRRKVTGVLLAASTVLGVVAPATTAFASTTTVSSLASQIISVAQREQTYSSIAGPVQAAVQQLTSSQWETILFGTTSVTPSQNALLGTVSQIVNFHIAAGASATDITDDTTAVERYINSAVSDLQGLNSSISEGDALDFLGALEQQVVGNLLSLSLTPGTPTPQDAQTAISGALASANSGYPEIASLFTPSSGTAGSLGAGTGAGGTGATGSTTGQPISDILGNLTKAFTEPLTTVNVAPAGGTFSTSAQGSTIQVNVPSQAFTSDSQLNIETVKTGTDFSPVLPGAYSLHLAVSLTFSASPKQAVGVTVSDPHIQKGTAVYQVTASGLKVVPATVNPKQASFSVSGNTNIVFVTPQAAPKMKSSQRALMFDGKVENVVPAQVKGGTTYMPIWYVQHLLEGFGFTSSWSLAKWQLTAPGISTAGVKTVSLNKSATGLYLNGKLIENAPTMQAIDPSTGRPTTFMAIWYVQQLLDQVNIPSQWDGTSWYLSMSYTPTSGSTTTTSSSAGTSSSSSSSSGQ